MARAQFKLLLFLFVTGLFAGVLALGWWLYQNVYLSEQRVQHELEAMKDQDRPRIDPGAKRFDAAIALVRGGSLEEGREALYKLVGQFPESATCPEARRIIGEINMDQLFSPSYRAGKTEYIVQPGDSLGRISDKVKTNIDYIIRLNSLMSSTLQPGDRLLVAPIDFHLGVLVKEKQVVLYRRVGEKDYAFKFYTAQDIVLPPGIKVPESYEIGVKSAQMDGEAVPNTDPQYAQADKWIPVHRPKAVASSFSFRVPVPPKAVPVPVTPADPKAVVAPPPAPETGIFLAPEDLEELFALVRRGSKVDLGR